MAGRLGASGSFKNIGYFNIALVASHHIPDCSRGVQPTGSAIGQHKVWSIQVTLSVQQVGEHLSSLLLPHKRECSRMNDSPGTLTQKV